ncbi:HTH-type transcriptional regulator PgrR [Alcanivorax sp. ALC70]|nr:LysR family transcriptional regulator [Alcanivorax sp.]MAY10301.1 LysR family transcriptional regulator [Alcanivorax sp.]MBI53720.1 LysR family transcriptional regulator [Alcanivorax sp.]UWN50204.1 HTH-type transcriptional regulator PgrR [Alcanivorax sp. ALC70]|tara:strand:- start:129567 stop:130460 length:894 start_codon:yes stop_codon:yes gene_type:complete
MLRENATDLMSFVVVARLGSFTSAAAQIGVSQSALSHAVRGLETRLGVRLLTRTTRKVTPTTEGERVLERIAPHFTQIEEELQALVETRDRPVGTIRITATDHAADTVIWPKLSPVLKAYPDLKVEVITDYSLTDIVAEKYDAGVRLGEQVSEGMIAVRVSADFRMLAVASPGYFEDRAPPRIPQDLTDHDCINLRLPTHGGLYAWEFEKGGRELRVRVNGQCTFNTIYPVVRAALAGHGLGYVPEGLVREHIDAGRLVPVLEDWSPPFPGYFLYYPHRRQSSLAFRVIVEALQHRD